MFRKFAAIINEVALIKQIAVGLVIGILLALYVPKAVPVVTIFGDLFVKALKGVAPVLVFFLVMNAMAKKKSGGEANMKPIIGLYVVGTFFASLVGVTLSFLAPTTLHLQVADAKLNPPSGIVEVLHNLILSVVDNPIAALLHANYIGILAWAVVFGIAMNMAANEHTKNALDDVAKAITLVVKWVIHFAPLGIMGLVAKRSVRNFQLCTPAGSAHQLLLPGSAGYESADRLLQHPSQSVSAGLGNHPRIRRIRFLYPQLRC